MGGDIDWECAEEGSKGDVAPQKSMVRREDLEAEKSASCGSDAWSGEDCIDSGGTSGMSRDFGMIDVWVLSFVNIV